MSKPRKLETSLGLENWDDLFSLESTDEREVVTTGEDPSTDPLASVTHVEGEGQAVLADVYEEPVADLDGVNVDLPTQPDVAEVNANLMNKGAANGMEPDPSNIELPSSSPLTPPDLANDDVTAESWFYSLEEMANEVEDKMEVNAEDPDAGVYSSDDGEGGGPSQIVIELAIPYGEDAIDSENLADVDEDDIDEDEHSLAMSEEGWFNVGFGPKFMKIKTQTVYNDVNKVFADLKAKGLDKVIQNFKEYYSKKKGWTTDGVSLNEDINKSVRWRAFTRVFHGGGFANWSFKQDDGCMLGFLIEKKSSAEKGSLVRTLVPFGVALAAKNKNAIRRAYIFFKDRNGKLQWKLIARMTYGNIREHMSQGWLDKTTNEIGKEGLDLGGAGMSTPMDDGVDQVVAYTVDDQPLDEYSDSVISEEKAQAFPANVKTKVELGKGFFTNNSAKEIAEKNLAAHNGNVGSTIKSLEFQLNRNKSQSPEVKKKIQAAISILQAKKPKVTESDKAKKAKSKESEDLTDLLNSGLQTADDTLGVPDAVQVYNSDSASSLDTNPPDEDDGVNVVLPDDLDAQQRESLLPKDYDDIVPTQINNSRMSTHQDLGVAVESALEYPSTLEDVETPISIGEDGYPVAGSNSLMPDEIPSVIEGDDVKILATAERWFLSLELSAETLMDMPDAPSSEGGEEPPPADPTVGIGIEKGEGTTPSSALPDGPNPNITQVSPGEDVDSLLSGSIESFFETFRR